MPVTVAGGWSAPTRAMRSELRKAARRGAVTEKIARMRFLQVRDGVAQAVSDGAALFGIALALDQVHVAIVATAELVSMF